MRSPLSLHMQATYVIIMHQQYGTLCNHHKFVIVVHVNATKFLSVTTCLCYSISKVARTINYMDVILE